MYQNASGTCSVIQKSAIKGRIYQKAEQFRVEPSKTRCVKCPDMSLFLLRDVRQMLLKLVELRSSDWGRVRAAAAASNATPDNDPNYFMVSVNCTIQYFF